MGRQIPKNVRQIGNVSDSSKIYIEDYVDIFLNQLYEKNQETMTGAFLLGQVVEEGENDYIYVNGCIHMQSLVRKGKDIIIEENVWKRACETCKEFFGDAEILGWALVGGECVIEMNHQIQKMHQKYFHREKSLFVTKNERDKEDKFYIYKYCDMLEAKGHYIFYERNAEMQEYMIHCRKNTGMTPSESVDDFAAKSFRSVIQEKLERKEAGKKFKPAYVMTLCCLLVVFGVGVTMLDKYKEILKEPEQQVVEEEPVEEIVIPVIQEEVVKEEPKELEEIQEEEEVSGIHMEEIYIVEKGDTLASISKEVYGDILHVVDICELNGLEDGNLIFIGQKLLLP